MSRELIEEGKTFNTIINDVTYECLIVHKLAMLDTGSIFYLYIRKLKSIKFFKWTFNVLDWYHECYIGSSSFIHKTLNYEIINHIHFFQVNDAKEWIDRAIKEYNKETTEELNEELNYKNVKHKEII